MRLDQVDHVAISVTDVERSVAWYLDVLGLERRYELWGSCPAMVCIGSNCVALFPVAGDQPEPPPGSGVLSMRHLAFRTDRPGFEQAQAELRARKIDFELQDHDIAHSIYFADPDGHSLEITTYDLA